MPENWGKVRLNVFWGVVLFLVIVPRVLLQNALPIYLFSDDSHSYLLSAFHWAQTGDWETSPRRGAIYSMLIAGALAVFQDLRTITYLQHFLGAFAILLVIRVFQTQVRPGLAAVALLVAGSLAVAGFPIFYEHSIRSEILLFFFSAIALASWASYCSTDKAWSLWATGIAFGMATLIKNLLLPLPLLVLVFVIAKRNNSVRQRMAHIASFGIAVSLPFLGNEIFNHTSGNLPESAPQSGILLYGRVAQWTVLDSALHPEIKQLITSDIEAYRELPRLNNNIILKRSAVPHIATWLGSRGGTRVDLNRVCRDLAFEAIRHHPREWCDQIIDDFLRLHGKMDFPLITPDADDLKDALSSASKIKQQSPILQQTSVMATLSDPATVRKLAPYHWMVSSSWMFAWRPVFLTSLLLPLVLLADPDRRRKQFWITLLIIWIFNVAIICTVGRPIPRYLAAVFPIMFWTIGGAVILVVAGVNRLIKSRSNKLRKLVKSDFRVENTNAGPASFL